MLTVPELRSSSETVHPENQRWVAESGFFTKLIEVIIYDFFIKHFVTDWTKVINLNRIGLA